MQMSLFAQINIIAVAAIGLLFCVLGYKFARFLMPVCGMIVIESILYVTVGGYVQSTNLSGALFYGGTAVASYVILFFALRLAGFFTGALGSALFLFFVIRAFGLSGTPVILPAAAAVAVVTGLASLVYERAGVIVATSLFGASVAGATGTFLIAAAGADAAVGQSMAELFGSMLGRHAYIFLAAVCVLAAAGLAVQFKLSAKNQLLSSRISIRLESKNAGI